MKRLPPMLVPALALAAIALLAWWAYAPGFSGGFLFDDYANLPALGATGPVDTWATFWRYLTSGTADPTGRPLALLSFLLDARNWPADPRPFRHTNFILHLINGVLLALLLRRLGMLLYTHRGHDPLLQTKLGRLSPLSQGAIGAEGANGGVEAHVGARSLRSKLWGGLMRSMTPTKGAGHARDFSKTAGFDHADDQAPDATNPHSGPRSPVPGPDLNRINLAAALAAGLWLLHPLFVSTTLYIVQREAMLPATFVLLGLLAWLHGRQRLMAGHRLSGLIWLVLGLGACTALAVLSKGNGILLPALALVLDYTVGRAGIRESGIGSGGKAGIRDSGFGNRQASPDSSDLPRHSREDASPVPFAGDMAREPGKAESLGSRLRGNDKQAKRHSRESGSPVPSGDRRRETLDPRMRGDDDQEPMNRDGRSLYRRAMLLLAWLPAAFVAIYLLNAGWSGMVHGISSIRPWTLGQRLLTEPRILLDYLGLLWMPRPFTPGLFNDFIQVSTSLLHPATTLPALLAVTGLIIGAVTMRRRWPALAAAVLFYFVGQSIESSTLSLELYYEHRNYLPALLMFWPLALWLCGLRNHVLMRDSATVRPPLGLPPQAGGEDVSAPSPAYGGEDVSAPSPAYGGEDVSAPSPARGGGPGWGAARKWTSSRGTAISPRFASTAKLIFAAVLLLGLALMTHARAGLWGNQRDQALLWAQLNPGSPRAQAFAGQAEIAAGYPQLAVKRLRRALDAAPDEPQLAFNLMAAECNLGRIDTATLQATKDSLHSAIKIGALLTHWFERNIDNAASPRCPQMSLDTLTSLLHGVEANPRLMTKAGRRQDVDYLLGRIALARGNGKIALQQFNHALDQQVRESMALQQAALLGSHGFPALGLAHLDHYDTIKSREDIPPTGMPRIHAWILKQQNYWPHELKHLRSTLTDDANQKAKAAKQQ